MPVRYSTDQISDSQLKIVAASPIRFQVTRQQGARFCYIHTIGRVNGGFPEILAVDVDHGVVPNIKDMIHYCALQVMEAAWGRNKDLRRVTTNSDSGLASVAFAMLYITKAHQRRKVFTKYLPSISPSNKVILLMPIFPRPSQDVIWG